MADFHCCPGAKWVRTKELGHADSFEFDLGKCSKCEKPWVHLYCVANHVTGFEPIKEEDLERLLSIENENEFKDATRNWFYGNVK